MSTLATPAKRLRSGGRIRFALGDFAFNLYWQSLTLYLLYFYTDVVGLSVASASLLYMVGSVWDGAVDLGVGILADRVRLGRGAFRTCLIAGALPLGTGFALLYAVPAPGALQLAAVAAAHLLFRTLYALINVPYSALTARITDDSRDRASISGWRMIFGTLAAIVVALATQPLAAWAGGQAEASRGYVVVAVLYASLGAAVMLVAGLGIRERIPAMHAHRRHDLRTALGTLMANRAFVTLVLAMMAAILGVTMLDRQILYQFKYVLREEAAGRAALATMSVAGGLAIPAWMGLGRWLGGRIVWLVSALLGLLAVAGFALVPEPGALATQAMLVAVQVAMMGLNFAFWALLPDTIEYGEHASGLRIEATTFGLGALSQKLAIGAAAGLFGLAFHLIGYRANTAQAPETIAGMRGLLLLAPACGFSGSATIILFNPLRRGTHRRIVAALRDGEPV